MLKPCWTKFALAMVLKSARSSRDADSPAKWSAAEMVLERARRAKEEAKEESVAEDDFDHRGQLVSGFSAYGEARGLCACLGGPSGSRLS